jgi:hypothetical protein
LEKSDLFPEQIIHWLRAWPVQPMLFHRPESTFPFIQITRPGQKSLVLHLIDLRGWQALDPALAGIKFSNVSQVLKNQGFDFVTLWEDVWRSRLPIVESRLEALLGFSQRIPARLTRVRRLDQPTAAAFLAENHLQAGVQAKYKYGMYLPQRYYRVLAPDFSEKLNLQPEELLVGVATFSNPRTFRRSGQPFRSFEMVRFANLLGTTVVGGLDKLLNAFNKEMQPDDIMTYADLDWSAGRSYERLGFVATGDTPPHELWLDLNGLHRYPPGRLPAGITPDIAPSHGFLKIYTSGSRKFVKQSRP